jgi:hypothetical protein
MKWKHLCPFKYTKYPKELEMKAMQQMEGVILNLNLRLIDANPCP